jgi:hypothetical protein
MQPLSISKSVAYFDDFDGTAIPKGFQRERNHLPG